MDISEDTPYYNEQLFRLYADRTFYGGAESLQASTAAFRSARFSSQYKGAVMLAAAKIDQNHPEIRNSLTELETQLSQATSRKAQKDLEFEQAWESVATARRLDPQGKPYEYNLQRVTWYAQARYADQIKVFSSRIDGINAQIDAVRRKAYTVAEAAVLDNLGVLSESYNIARPWNANTERSARAQGQPLTDALLSDPTSLPPSMFDSSPLVLPVGDMVAFLNSPGTRAFDTLTQSSSMDASTRSWTASGGGSFFGISLGGGGSGSSSFQRNIETLQSLEASFQNVSEYLVDRSSWFNPAVLQDPATVRLIEGRRELDNLRYVCVSLLLVRGLSLRLRFSEKVNSAEWSQQAVRARGGGSFFGFSVGGRGGSTSSESQVKVDATGTSVTFEDGPKVVRVIGARVEPFVALPGAREMAGVSAVTRVDPAAPDVRALRAGKTNYIDFQRAKINAIAK